MEYHKQERLKIQYIGKSLQQFQLYPSKKKPGIGTISKAKPINKP
jgi:hypothetical protein